jgi:hypothetical protein
VLFACGGLDAKSRQRLKMGRWGRFKSKVGLYLVWLETTAEKRFRGSS